MKMVPTGFLCGFLAALCITSARTAAGEQLNRILDGHIATQDQFPYVVSIQFAGQTVQTETRGHRCGGGLISLQHVLTSASSLHDQIVGGASVLISVSQYRVFAGANFLTNDTVAERIRTIGNITVHPEYRPNVMPVNADIAIITLSSPYAASVVKPLSLPSQDFAPADFSLCTIAGWGGSTPNVTASVQLRYGTKYIYNPNQCNALYISLHPSMTIVSSMICAVPYENFTPSCMGDGGNALVCSNTLSGVLSQSLGCNVTNFPEVYTRISNYTTWIRSVSGSGTVFDVNIFMLLGLSSFLLTSLL